MARLNGSAASAAHAMLAGGGSGGHVFPGLAIAAELRRRGWQVSWAGSAQGMEARLARERELDFYDLPSRPLVGRGVLGKLGSMATLGYAALRGRRLVRRVGAKVVVGTGGYASAPAVLGARLAARPVLLVEPNAGPGFANRWLSRFAAEAAVAYEETAATLHCPSHTTGVPIRGEFFEVPPELPETAPRLLVLGGSQGARQLNELLPAALDGLGDVSVLHQAGEGHLEATRQAYAGAGVDAEVVAFLDDVAGAMARSHLVVSRAGAITLAEICAAGRPALLAPLQLAGAHQVANARRLVAARAAEILEAEAGAEDLRTLLRNLLDDAERLRSMGRAARGLAREGAAAAIADRVEHLGRVA